MTSPNWYWPSYEPNRFERVAKAEREIAARRAKEALTAIYTSWRRR